MLKIAYQLGQQQALLDFEKAAAPSPEMMQGIIQRMVASGKATPKRIERFARTRRGLGSHTPTLAARPTPQQAANYRTQIDRDLYNSAMAQSTEIALRNPENAAALLGPESVAAARYEKLQRGLQEAAPMMPKAASWTER